jgi:hypothetical protein
MKRILVPTILAATLCTVTALVPSNLSPVKPARAAGFEGDRPCSLANLAGRRGYSYSGAITAGPAAGPAASAGSFTQDASGNFKGSQTRSFNGDVANETLTGTISVNPDCTAVATVNVYQSGVFERTSVLDAVYVDNERGVRAIFTTPFTVITLEGRKINPE